MLLSHLWYGPYTADHCTVGLRPVGCVIVVLGQKTWFASSAVSNTGNQPYHFSALVLDIPCSHRQ